MPIFDQLLAKCVGHPLALQVRAKHNTVNFFSRRTSEWLWRTVTNVSPAGMKRGRSVTRQIVRPLPNFYKIGMLKSSPMRVRYPGLNAPMFSLSDVKEPLYFEEQTEEEREESLHFVRSMVTRQGTMKKPSYIKECLWPLERGFSGGTLTGQAIGPPPDQDGHSMADFECVLLFHDRISRMHPVKGRIQKCRALMFIGNRNGVGGFAMARASPVKLNLAIGRAIKQASKSLFHIERLENRTIFQDFFAECRNTRLFVQRQVEGYGLICPPRVIKICQLLGIKDLLVRNEGSSNNYVAVAKAFVTGLINQETHQQLADRTRLHVVELSPNRQYFPHIVASPLNAPVKDDSEVERKERLRLDDYYGEGRWPLNKPKKRPRWINSPLHLHAEWRKHPYRNMEEKIIRLLADGVVKRWTRRERYQWSQREYQMVMNGQKAMPLGIGLTDVYPLAKEE